MKRKNDATDKINTAANDVAPKSYSKPATNLRGIHRGEKVKQGLKTIDKNKNGCRIKKKAARHILKQDIQDLEEIQNKGLQGKITAKLQTLFEGFVSEFHSIPKSKRGDFKRLFKSDTTPTPLSFPSVNSKRDYSNSDNASSSLAVQKFVNSAKSRISELLNKKKVQVFSPNSTSNNSKSSFVDPLEIQISLKLQSLFCQALENKRLECGKNGRTSPKIGVTEWEWQDLSGLLQDFMNSAKKKLSDSLSRALKFDSTDSSIYSSQINNTDQSENKLASATVPNQYLNKNILDDPLASTSNMDCYDAFCGTNLRDSSTLSIKMESNSSESECSEHDGILSRNIYDDRNPILLLDECEKTPDILDLGINFDVDDPSFENSPSDSDEDVILLGVKRPTYQEVTLEEDDSGEVVESAIEKEKPLLEEKEIEGPLFECPQCDKSFRVESLLNFHIRMHGLPNASASEPSSPDSSINRIESPQERSSSISKSCSKKEKENRVKAIPKNLSHKHKIHRYKHGRRKSKADS